MKQRIKTILQARHQSFEDYDKCLEKKIEKIRKENQMLDHEIVFPFSTSASDGRLNTMLFWFEKDKQNINK